MNLTVEALNSSAVNLTWFLPRQPHGKITSFKISVKHARTGAIVKDTTVKVEEILNGALPECTVSGVPLCKLYGMFGLEFRSKCDYQVKVKQSTQILCNARCFFLFVFHDVTYLINFKSHFSFY